MGEKLKRISVTGRGNLFWLLKANIFSGNIYHIRYDLCLLVTIYMYLYEFNGHVEVSDTSECLKCLKIDWKYLYMIMS